MPADKKTELLSRGRLLCQILGFVAAALGYFAIVRSFGLPKWLFMLTILVVGLFFCGWACPFGSAQEWLRSLGKRLFGFTWKVPARIDRYLLFSRYIFAATLLTMTVSALDVRKTFISTLSGKADIVFGVALAILAAFLLLSLVVERPYCKYLCGFGAMAGALSMARFFGVKRAAEACTGCGKCDRACGMGVEVSLAHTVRDPNCINCGKCVAACPKPGTLTVGFAPPCRADVQALARKWKAPREAETRTIVREGGYD